MLSTVQINNANPSPTAVMFMYSLIFPLCQFFMPSGNYQSCNKLAPHMLQWPTTPLHFHIEVDKHATDCVSLSLHSDHEVWQDTLYRATESHWFAHFSEVNKLEPSDKVTRCIVTESYRECGSGWMCEWSIHTVWHNDILYCVTSSSKEVLLCLSREWFMWYTVISSCVSSGVLF